MIEINPPMSVPNERLTVFLAGSINNGASRDWQSEVVGLLHDFTDDIIIYNPRRASWNSDPDPEFLSLQIKWELEHIVRADFVFFYFDEAGLSPVSMLELGLCVNSHAMRLPNSGGRLIVVAHPKAPRRTNLQVTIAGGFGIPVFSDLKLSVFTLRQRIQEAIRQRQEAQQDFHAACAEIVR